MKENKIIPDKAYMINRANFASQANVLAKICMTLRYAKKDPMKPDIFLDYIIRALAFGKCIIFVTFDDKEELNGCAVFLINNTTRGKILWIEWVWSNYKDLKLGRKKFKEIIDLAQKLKFDKIAGAMNRNFGAVLKRYGFKEAYRVLEIEVKKNVEKD